MNVLLVAGLAAVIVGVLGVFTGITDAVEAAGGIREDAVATGVVGDDIAIEGADVKQTVYLDFDEFGNNSLFHDSVVSATSCEVTADGYRDSFSGSVQGVSTTIGRYSSVGTFTLPDGFGRITCSTSAVRDRNVPLVVSPRGGGAVFAAVLKIIGGALLFCLGVIGAIIGALRRRRAGRAAPPPAGLPR